MTSNRRIENSTLGFKIVEKVFTMMTRFLVFCSQDPSLAAAIVEASQSKRDTSVSLKDIPNLEFRLLMLRNLIFWNNSPEVTSSLSEQLYFTLKQISKSFSAYKEQAFKF